MSDGREREEDSSDARYLNLVREFKDSIRYGSILISIQDGRIVQVEKNEKFRIRPSNGPNPSADRTT